MICSIRFSDVAWFYYDYDYYDYYHVKYSDRDSL